MSYKDTICSILLILLTILITIIYAHSLILISIFVLSFTGLFHIFGFIKKRLFGQNNCQKLANI